MVHGGNVATLLTNTFQGVYSNSVRKLRYTGPIRWQRNRTCTMGYSWSGRVRSITTPELPRKRCHSHSVLDRLPCQPRQRARQGMFSREVDNSIAFDALSPQWFPEVAHFCEGTPLILVGTKIDLRRDEQTRRMLGAQGQAPVSTEQGQSVAKEIGARYIECSAKTGTGVQEVFGLALKESMRGKWGKKLKQQRCVII